jgi:hypothetical protein
VVQEINEVYRYLEPRVSREAKERQEATQLVGKGIQKQDVDGGGNLPQPYKQEDTGKTRDKIASYLGVSGRTLDKIVTIVEDGNSEEIQEADSKSRRINAVYKKIKNRKKQEEAPETPQLPEGVYNVIYADPPWRYQFSETYSRAIPTHYPDMELEDICKLEVPSADNSILFLWATNPKLEEAFKVIHSWGFTYAHIQFKET